MNRYVLSMVWSVYLCEPVGRVRLVCTLCVGGSSSVRNHVVIAYLLLACSLRSILTVGVKCLGY